MARPGTRFAGWLTDLVGRPGALAFAIALVIGWLPTYVLIRDFDSWQILINTVTTIITFVMVFAIQSTQNRESRAINTKLDALVAVNPEASNCLVGLEARDDDEIKQRQSELHGRVNNSDD